MHRELKNRLARSSESPPTSCHAEQRAATDQFCLERQAQGDRSTRRDRNGEHVHCHAKCEGEPFPESHRAHLVVGFKPSGLLVKGEISIVSPELPIYCRKKIPERKAPNRKTLSTIVSSRNSTTAATSIVSTKPRRDPKFSRLKRFERLELFERSCDPFSASGCKCHRIGERNESLRRHDTAMIPHFHVSGIPKTWKFVSGVGKWSPTGKPVLPSTAPVGRNPEREPPAKAGAESKGRSSDPDPD